MNTLPSTTASVNWAINPDAQFITTASVARQFGVEDAAAGMPCLPEIYFGSIADRIAYVEGWRSVGGDTPTTRLFLGEPQEEEEWEDYLAEVAYLRGPH